MNKHEQKYCPRCTAVFECKVGNITQCQCLNISLNVEEQAYMGSLYQDCLCAACIAAVQAEYNSKKFTARLKKLFRFG
jgi:hypothetical protein